ncbi:tRNA (adenosine(37)-N6)-threonylcarbamoyltransferase complex ATPase subunit type 1 TsaE [Hyphomicrobium methylovorum]|uniref:tRNA (adenosine(37)-N6)-threonylcarbamoyltransferase complex ATPase subunit type 1 TsaE n=1 Tax=Hyphomicrobium methylovorum TaxID=84 RepID=UPI0015E712AC|nr:tRNA (adenosine(37)-N6)-threonylcarbamoyltransferase complex ATPase subunit type 1 TsaE [Hyphomicrobium methylovorum]MBA2125553.1 tRNA (adenosine(37)-N6)-threonylcarbamoyltransferase complex ATPase subunit type 1 TsaE [Hyphomicrobium methylovorum]
MTNSFQFRDLTESETIRLAGEIAFLVQPGDTLGLEGDLGTGKSTFARALIRSLADDGLLDVPSPTFTLTQSYETRRFDVAHFDLYRLTEPDELDELGLDAALRRGIALIEWPSRGGNRLPPERFTLRFEEGRADNRRNVTLRAPAELMQRLARFAAIRTFLETNGWGEADTSIAYLQGDASPRRYARLTKADGTRAILVDSPRRPDGPPIRDGKAYSAIAHLAEDVGAFVAVGNALSTAGVSTPRIFAEDLDQGLLLIEDFGDRVFGGLVVSGAADQRDLWQRATDTLAALQAVAPQQRIPISDARTFVIPEIDRDVLAIETELLVDWYWPALHGRDATQLERDRFSAAWAPVFQRMLAAPRTWLLRDYHSPNLILLDRPAPRDVGIIDFQDALIGPAAYDLVSLLQDARVDVPAKLERELIDHYVGLVSQRDRTFDADAFRAIYAALGAQRNTKILGIFARLAIRDGKRQYLAHMPRIWGYLERNLQHETLPDLAAWYDENLPRHRRTSSLTI